MRIQNLFLQARALHQKLFIPFLFCGDPDLATTKLLIKELVKLNADIIEVGVPFSDPIADGPINQDASFRALKNSISLHDCCLLIKELRQENCHIPIILYTYFNPILQLGLEKFIDLAKSAKIDAVLIVDSPMDEIRSNLPALQKNGIDVAILIAPTTPKERIKQAITLKPAFLYYISRNSVTGVQTSLAPNLKNALTTIKELTSLPIAAGVGISTPQQIKQLVEMDVDGVIVGSALVKHLADQKQGVKNFLLTAKNLITVLKKKTVSL